MGNAALLLELPEILCYSRQSCKAPGTLGSSSAGCDGTVVDGRTDGGAHVRVAAECLGSLGCDRLHGFLLIFQCEVCLIRSLFGWGAGAGVVFDLLHLLASPCQCDYALVLDHSEPTVVARSRPYASALKDVER